MESVGNSTIQILDASATVAGIFPGVFNGTPQDTQGYNSVNIICSADQSGTIYAMHSMDNSVWDISDSILYPGSGGVVGTASYNTRALHSRWFKTKFVNPGSVSCNLRLQTMLHQGRPLDTTHDSVTTSGTVSGTVAINITQQELSFVEISGNVSIRNPSLVVSRVPISTVWETSDISTARTVESTGLVMYTVYCMNFKTSDFRYVKLYDLSTSIDPAVDIPKFTIPLPALLFYGDSAQNRQFPSGFAFNDGLQVRVTTGIAATDTSMAADGEAHISITYTV
jgi:hypothetical protein